MKVVATNRGLIARDDLTLSVQVVESHNSIDLVTTWRLKSEGVDGRHVRQDLSVVFLSTPEIQAQAMALPADAKLAAPLPHPADVAAAAPGADVTVGLTGQQIGTEQAQLGT